MIIVSWEARRDNVGAAVPSKSWISLKKLITRLGERTETWITRYIRDKKTQLVADYDEVPAQET